MDLLFWGSCVLELWEDYGKLKIHTITLRTTFNKIIIIMKYIYIYIYLVLPVYCYQPISLHPRADMLSHVIPWTSACQTPLSMDFSRQEYWSGLPFPSPMRYSFKRQEMWWNKILKILKYSVQIIAVKCRKRNKE